VPEEIGTCAAIIQAYNNDEIRKERPEFGVAGKVRSVFPRDVFMNVYGSRAMSTSLLRVLTRHPDEARR